MWSSPWRYKEGFAISAGLILTGLILQLATGPADTGLLHYPFNLIAGSVYLLALAGIYFLSGRIRALRWFTGYEAAVTSLLPFLVLVVMMGLIPQVRSGRETGCSFGFSDMLSAWPFVLLFVYFISVLGLVTLRRLAHPRIKDIPFLLNHAGLFLALAGAILGNGDLVRLRLTSYEGKPEWRAADSRGEWHELPLAIELIRFTIDEYPPKLMLIDNETGKALPAAQPENLTVEDSVSSGTIAGWEIEVTRLLPLCAGVADKDTVNFVPYSSLGATTAVYVTAHQTVTGRQAEGWVSCGSFLFPYKALRLNEEVSLVMPDREPRKFSSDVKIYTQNKAVYTPVIEVNRPFGVSGWKIYQLSYDESKGKWSDYSVFELVKDPWLPVVYTGIGMLIAGAVCMFVFAQKRKEL